MDWNLLQYTIARLWLPSTFSLIVLAGVALFLECLFPSITVKLLRMNAKNGDLTLVLEVHMFEQLFHRCLQYISYLDYPCHLYRCNNIDAIHYYSYLWCRFSLVDYRFGRKRQNTCFHVIMEYC